MQITAFLTIVLSSMAALAAPVKRQNSGLPKEILGGSFGLDADTIERLTRQFPNEPSAADCAGNDLSFGQQRQCIDAGLLDDPSFKRAAAGEKRQFGLDADTIARLTKQFPNAPSAEDCARDDLSFGQQRQCIDAGLLDDPSF